MTHWKPGISVIIPSLMGSKTLHSALRSLAAQDLERERFEVILVLNGSRASVTPIAELRRSFSEINLRILQSKTPSAGRARNIGLINAQYMYSTFLDDDDCLEASYLSTALRHAKNSACVLMPIIDVKENNQNRLNSLNVRIRSISGGSIPIATVPWALGFNACKVAPTELMSSYRYEESLQSGEDVVFFANFLKHPNLEIISPTATENIGYLRTISDESVSRQDESFEFNVIQRLQCISLLRGIEVPKGSKGALESLENAQFNFISNYISKHPEQLEMAMNEAVRQRVAGIDWEPLRTEGASKVVFSYCFPPFADTSANVVAKLIRSTADPVDVFYADMARVRPKDISTRLIVDPFVVHSEEIHVEPSFTNWFLISEFAKKANRAATKRQKAHGKYETMYSRSMWSGSHVAALLFKVKNPHVFWEAEFSDPLAIGVDGRRREGDLIRNQVTRRMKSALKESGWDACGFATHFELTELTTLACADRVVFTNENQRRVMLDRYPLDFRDFVDEKSLIRSHLTPSSEMYQLAAASYELETDAINLAYFGNFYENRGIEDVLDAVDEHNKVDSSKITLHVFTGDPTLISSQHTDSILRGSLRINGYLPYLEFLNLSRRFDVLVVLDALINDGEFLINPFLPSKYADYSGAGVPIWGLTTPGSPLSKVPLQFNSALGSKAAALAVINAIAKNNQKHRRDQK